MWGRVRREREKQSRGEGLPFFICNLQPFFEELDDCDREFDKRNKVCLQHKSGEDD